MSLQPHLLQTLRERRAAIEAGGGLDKIEERHAKGLLSARERLDALFEPGTFQEIGMHVRHRAPTSAWTSKELPADGVITGTGYRRWRAGRRLQPGFHRRRRHARQDARAEDRAR